MKIFSRKVVFVDKALRYQDFIIVSKYPRTLFDHSEINFRNDVNNPRFSYIDSYICGYFDFSIVTKKERFFNCYKKREIFQLLQKKKENA